MKNGVKAGLIRYRKGESRDDEFGYPRRKVTVEKVVVGAFKAGSKVVVGKDGVGPTSCRKKSKRKTKKLIKAK
jgi:hypothetical protein